MIDSWAPVVPCSWQLLHSMAELLLPWRNCSASGLHLPNRWWFGVLALQRWMKQVDPLLCLSLPLPKPVAATVVVVLSTVPVAVGVAVAVWSGYVVAVAAVVAMTVLEN